MNENYYWMCKAMDAWGGDFVRALADCFRKADSKNFQTLLDAFPDYVSQYMKMAEKLPKDNLR